MDMNRIRRLVTSLGLFVPVCTAVGCGDPCLDDGLGQIGTDCVAQPAAEDDGSGGPSAMDESGEGDSTGADDTDSAGEGEGDGSDTGEPEPEPEHMFYRDADEDGYGDPEDSVSVEDDMPPEGYVDNADDCDDTTATTHPGAAELDDPTACMNDDDDDGWGDDDVPAAVTAGQDCDDDSDTTHPGAAENEDADACTKDDDNDGWGDSEPPPGVDPGDDCADQDPELFGCHNVWCLDLDGDGYGDPLECVPGGDLPPSDDHVPNDDDCIDTEAGVYPGAAANEPLLCTVDADGDGWGSSMPPAGADAGSDCTDANPHAYPGAAINEHVLCTIDADGDGWGDAQASVLDPLVQDGSDCIDSDANIYPGAAANEPGLCTIDADADGYGSSTPPPGADAGGDCDDAQPLAFPGAAELEDPPLATQCLLDADEDGFGDDDPPGAILSGTDCNDASVNTHPGAAELDDADACMADEDLDGYGESDPPAGVISGQDCEDANPLVTICGQWCFDGDGDGFGDPGNCDLSGDSPGPDWVNNDIDCVDTDLAIYPGAAANEPALCAVDADADGWGDGTPPPGADVGSDCDDGSLTTFPGAAELDDAELCMNDDDDDGWGDLSPNPGVAVGTDCVDSDAAVFPSAAASELTLCTIDADGDGFGDADASAVYPGAQDGTDCADDQAFAFPGASESEAGPLAAACTLDADEDGYGDDNPPPQVTAGTDCDDGIETTHPGAAEIENPAACMADADLDGYGDAGAPVGVLSGLDCEDDNPLVTICDQWCLDSDGDGFGGPTCQLSADAPDVDWVNNDLDCVDDNAGVYPGAAANEPASCTIDADGDGFGPTAPPAGADAGADCDDTSAFAQPGAAPLDDPAACMLDADGDDYGDTSPPAGVTPGSDCGDSSAAVYPGAADLEPGLCTADVDDDGYGDDSISGAVAGAQDGSDCDDGSAATFPGAATAEPGLCTLDSDGDGFGADTVNAGVDAGSDCDDASANTFPGAAPNEDDPLGCFNDDDGDGYGDTDPPTGVTSGLDCDDDDPGFADCTCLAPLAYLECDGAPGAPAGDAFQAMGLGCSADIDESMVLDSSVFNVVDAASWAIINQYGTAADPANPAVGAWSPRPDAQNPDAQHNAASNMLLLSTGPITPADGSGVVIEAASSQAGGAPTDNPDGAPYPAPITETTGSNGTPFEGCDGTNDCSDSLDGLNLTGLGLNDQVHMEVTLTVPEGVDGFRFDFAYFSGEYPEYVDTNFNDIFVVWVQSGSFTGNVAVTQDGTPFTITELANAGEMSIVGADPLLAGTGFEEHGATGWRSVLASVIPGETITVSFFLADVADTAFTTAVLIDNFRWDCAGCDGVGDCGLTTLQ